MKIFIGSAGKSRYIANRIENIVKDFLKKDATVWTNADFISSEFTLESLQKFTEEYDAGIFVFSDDDQIIIGNKKNQPPANKVRDNVLFEAGLFIGKKGRNSVCIFSVPEVEKPSDLGGITYINYRESDEDIKNKLEKWILNIKSPIEIKTRKESDYKVAFPLELLWQNTKKITFVNYAASTFTISNKLSDEYDPSFRELYLKKVEEGVSFAFILTEPKSFADVDATRYKMSIKGKFPTSEIISRAVDVVKSDIDYYDKKRIRNPKIGNIVLLLSKIALPYALLKVEYTLGHESKNYIQVDIYSPMIGDDKERRRIVVRPDSDNYNFFDYNITQIWDDALNKR